MYPKLNPRPYYIISIISVNSPYNSKPYSNCLGMIMPYHKHLNKCRYHFEVRMKYPIQESGTTILELIQAPTLSSPAKSVKTLNSPALLPKPQHVEGSN